ncbi:MAG: ATP-binding cassette domain-containing protein [Planctomycetota bacterium]|nr:MAG: ATP-binding cassette domain-containing protein [Planctomycetota bacterium]
MVLERVTKRFGEVVAVRDLSLRVPRGVIYGFLGPNGAGKTTTIRMITGIYLPDAGRLEVLGQPTGEAVKERIGYLPEERGLYKRMRAAEIIAYFGRLKGLGRVEADRRARALLERYGLGAWADRPCQALSKGMGQKVQILATIVHEPELVIFDEPFSGLDPINVELMRGLILDCKAEGRTVIFSTHVLEQAEQICDFIFLIDKGQKLLDGPLAEVRGRNGESVWLEYDGDGAVLRELEGVERLNDAGKVAEIVLRKGYDPQKLLAQLVGRVRIRRFDLRAPSLHEVFVRAVRRHEQEAQTHA